MLPEYLDKIKSGSVSQKNLATVGRYMLSKQSLIMEKLDEEKLLISKPKVLVRRFIKPVVESTLEHEDVHTIQEKKREIKNLLKELESKELTLKKQAVLSNLVSCSPRERSILTEQDIHALKQLLVKHSKLERQLIRKNKEIQEHTEMIKIQNLEKDKELKDEQRKIRRQIAEQKLKLLEMKQARRKEAYAQSQQQLDSLKKDNYLYVKAEKAVKEELKKQRQLKLQQLKKAFDSNHVGLEEIKRHQENYQQIINQKKDQRQKQLSQLRSQSEYIIPAPNIFSELIRKQREQIQSDYQQKLEQRLQNKKRLIGYSTEVRNKNKSQGPSKKSIDTQRTSVSITKPLDRTQLLRIGEDYLDRAKRAGKKNSSHKVLQTESLLTQRYMDYLKDNTPKYDIEKDKRQIRRVKELVEQSDANLGQLQRAVDVANKLQQKAGWISERLANSIQAKLLILNKLK